MRTTMMHFHIKHVSTEKALKTASRNNRNAAETHQTID